MAASTCHGPLVLCPGKKVRVQALVAAPRQRRAQAQPVDPASGPDHRIRRAEE
jgi:hypothetical protein